MPIPYDESAWQRLQDDLGVGQVCGDAAGKLHAYAKAALQQSTAALIGESEPTPDEAAHVLDLLRAYRNAAHDAAQRYLAAVAFIDALTRQVEPPGSKPVAAASRRRHPVA